MPTRALRLAIGEVLRFHWPALGGLALIVLCLPVLTRAAEVRIPSNR